MTSKVGRISNLSLFDHSDHTLKLCSSHRKKAQQAIAATIDDLFVNNTTFHNLFEEVMKGLKKSPMTFSVTHEAISIGESGKKPHVLEFADLAPTEETQDIIDKSQALLLKIDGIYARCISENHDPRDHKTSHSLTKSRVSPLEISPRSSRSSRSRRASTGSESTIESEVAETRSKRPRRPSPLPVHTASPRAPSRKKVDRETEMDSPIAAPHKKTRASSTTARTGVGRANADLDTTGPAMIDAATDAEPIVVPALRATIAELESTKKALEAAEKRIQEMNAVFKDMRASHPKVDHELLSTYLILADSIEKSSLDELPEQLISTFKGLDASTTHSIFRNMYLILSKKATEAEPADEADRWKIGQKFFFEKGYLGTSLTTDELNQARADAIRFFVMISLLNEFNTSFLDGTPSDKPDSDLIALYDMLPLNMRHKIEGLLWQIKGADKSQRSNYGYLAFHGLEGQAATDADRAQALREYFEEAIAK